MEKKLPEQAGNWVGKSILRVEDGALLTGRGRYVDDLPTKPGTCHAAILRSPHGHARINRIDTGKALALPGVIAVLTAEDIQRYGSSLVVGVKAPIECWPIAVDKVRYFGEPVAIVVAASRYIAEDALDLIDVSYTVLPAVTDPVEALGDKAPVLHDGLNGNLANERLFRYGDPETAFKSAPRTISIDVRYPRNACTPIETYGVVAEYDPTDNSYDILANFQGPFSIHAVMARGLNVPGNRLRLRTPPDSGGSFGVKQAIFPYVVLMGIAARVAGRPVKWIEDRMEHLMASVTATNRVTRLEAAVEADGRITALHWDQIEDCGAHLRAPEPATLYRMHGNMTGAYAIPNVSIRNRIVLTNKMPTGLNRGFGGPQVYFALERLVQHIAVELSLDPLDVVRTNLIPAAAFPYRTATGALYDSGNYQAAIDAAIRDGGLAELLAVRDAARAEGRLFGIGYTAVVEPSVSNMGYISAVLSPEQRAKAGPKNGAQATATIGIDALGSVSVHVASVPQGQGHRTVLSQVVADIFGLTPADIRVVTELDTAKDAWSIASGNYSSRFAAAVAGAADIAARRVRAKLAAIAARQLKAEQEDIVFENGRVHAGDPQRGIPFARVASSSHWAPGELPQGIDHAIRETAFWSPPELTAPDEQDRVNSSLCHGFIFDICAVEIDQKTASVTIRKYVTMHDCGRVLHPGMVEGQVTGGFAQALGAALYEETSYGEDGGLQSGTLADYLIPTIMETPPITILHYESPSPFTPLGAKGVGEGNCMSTPVCIANAVADALGISDVALPLSPAKLARYIHGEEPAPARPPKAIPKFITAKAGERALTGQGEAIVEASRQRIWDMLLNPDELMSIIPGAHGVQKTTDTEFRADVTLGIGPVKGRYSAVIKLSDLNEPESVTLTGGTSGALGNGEGRGTVTLTEISAGTTRISYQYTATVGGKVASIGGRLLDGAARVVIGQFFEALAAKAGGKKRGFSLITVLKRIAIALGVSR
ncbi:molybdopterin cofactor-binding domain-containing protein [Brucella sp. 10RB9213]|uniref:xanthine dehydrogenase family protein molybdopterin-binding subunit n=1 Tax=Brucella sp. 10RB9213 TaxID=1844039 RepID=UPI0012ADA724|nr:molybdopterin cofactor-binding domain-containing protein [Brucella sp. 10RB9213]MRN67552.1 molybdopterin-dependent oxidoreductase [Brucella sp. 10RB9213]